MNFLVLLGLIIDNRERNEVLVECWNFFERKYFIVRVNFKIFFGFVEKRLSERYFIVGCVLSDSW